jgi:hypothetical protein
MAEAEQLRLECSIKQECRWLITEDRRCVVTNPVVSMLVEIDLEANTWVEIWTQEDGTQHGRSGKLRSVTQYEITLDETSYADGSMEQERISRTSGAYLYVERRAPRPVPMEMKWSGTCKPTTKPLPSAKF